MNTRTEEGRLPIAGGLELYYATIGQGEPIVFLHGGPGLWHDYFRPHMDALADGHRLVFFDQRGGGRSAATLTAEQAAITEFVEDIERLRDGLGLGAINILGHSWGGVLGMLYAARHPETVRSLVLVDSAAPTPPLMMATMTNRQQRMAANAALMALAQSAGFQAREPESLVRYLELMDADSFADRSSAKGLHLGATVEFAAALFAVSGLLFPQMATLDVAKEFDAIRCPTLVIHGRDDFIPLESSETIHAGIGGARLEVLETGHFPFIERPEAFFRLVREFLASS